jgi:hypothetical protein
MGVTKVRSMGLKCLYIIHDGGHDENYIINADGDDLIQLTNSQATTKYHDVNAVLADGFIRTPACVEEPGLGGMGIHFINPARIMDPAISRLEPEILLYLETEDRMKLLGVEYMFPIGPPDAPAPNPAPRHPSSLAGHSPNRGDQNVYKSLIPSIDRCCHNVDRHLCPGCVRESR